MERRTRLTPRKIRQTRFWAVRDYLAPVLRDSKFKETGRITPDEFVAAGDFLVYKFPTWQWEAGEPSKRRDFLPADKQYLVSRNGQSLPAFVSCSESRSPYFCILKTELTQSRLPLPCPVDVVGSSRRLPLSSNDLPDLTSALPAPSVSARPTGRRHAG